MDKDPLVQRKRFAYDTVNTLWQGDMSVGPYLTIGQRIGNASLYMFGQIQASILTLYKNQKITPVIVLDEMHLASNAFLDDISLLFNFCMDSENPSLPYWFATSFGQA